MSVLNIQISTESTLYCRSWVLVWSNQQQKIPDISQSDARDIDSFDF
jgi:hypothetical protein